MPRRVIYGLSLAAFVGASACTVASLLLPEWVSYTSPSDHDPVSVSYGLFQQCLSISGKCMPFPTDLECQGNNKSFCALWKSVGFFVNFALIIELASVVAYITVFAGGRGAREAGWKVISPLLALIALCQLISMALVAYSFDHDERFFIGWELDKSWILCTVSWTVLLLNAIGLVSAAYVLPYEDDYEPI